MEKFLFLVIFFFFVFHEARADTQGKEGLEDGGETPSTLWAETIPLRPSDSITGSEFAMRTEKMSGEERQQAALIELLKGNIPDFLRVLKPVRFQGKTGEGQQYDATIWVMPDYLSIGSNDDFLRMPLTYSSAITITSKFGYILPTRKMVDAIYSQSKCRLKPEPLPPGPHMRSSEYYLEHQKMIWDQRVNAGCELGELTSGNKKDLVLTNRLVLKKGRIAIYGWQQKSGRPIQPLSTVHSEEYADYSHGVRMVHQTFQMNEEPLSIIDVLQDPQLGSVLTYEGVIPYLGKLLKIKDEAQSQ